MGVRMPPSSRVIGTSAQSLIETDDEDRIGARRTFPQDGTHQPTSVNADDDAVLCRHNPRGVATKGSLCSLTRLRHGLCESAPQCPIMSKTDN